MKEEAKTYEELIRKKRCIDITKYYELDENDLETIYNFLKENNLKYDNNIQYSGDCGLNYQQIDCRFRHRKIKRSYIIKL